jgi:hypothetical protein
MPCVIDQEKSLETQIPNKRYSAYPKFALRKEHSINLLDLKTVITLVKDDGKGKTE